MSSSKDFLTAKFRCLSRGISSASSPSSASAPEFQSWGDSNDEPPTTENGTYYALQDVPADPSRPSTINSSSNLTLYSRGGQHNNHKDNLLGSLPSINPSKLKKRLTFILWVTAVVVALRFVFALPSVVRQKVFAKLSTTQLVAKVSDSDVSSSTGDIGSQLGVRFLDRFMKKDSSEERDPDERDPDQLGRGDLAAESIDGSSGGAGDAVRGNGSKANLIDRDNEDEGVIEDDDKEDDKNDDKNDDKDDDDDDDDDKDKDDKNKDKDEKDKDKDEKEKHGKDKDEDDDEYDDDEDDEDDEDDKLIVDDADDSAGDRKREDRKRMSEIMDKMEEIRKKRQNKAKQADAAAKDQQHEEKHKFEAKQKAAKKQLEAKRKAEKKQRKAEKKEREAKQKAAKKEFEAKQKAAAKQQFEEKQKAAAAEKQHPEAKERAAEKERFEAKQQPEEAKERAAEQLIEAQQIAATLK